MKVALLKSRLEHVGGLEKYTIALAKNFANKGCEVTILTTDTSSHQLALSLGKSSKFSLYHHLHFDSLCQKWLRENPQDIIFGMERNRFQTHYRAGSGVHAIYLKRRKELEGFGKRISLSCNPLHHFLLHRERAAFEDPQLKKLFTNSYMVKEQILETYSVHPDKVAVVHNGVDWHAFEAPFQQRKKSDLFTFLFVGNGYQRKGLSYLLEALPLVRGKWRLLVIGKEKNLPLFQKQAPPSVHFLGPQSRMLPFYQQADALVIPSLYDPFSNVTLEALAMGLTVVSSRYNGGCEILTRENGVVIDNLFSKESLAISLEQAMEQRATPLSIRESVKGLDFSIQLDKIVQITLHD